MKILFKIWFILFIANVLILSIRLFNISDNKITFSIWAKIFPLQFLIIICAYFTSFIIYNGLPPISIWSLGLLLFSGYCVYAAFAFRYSYNLDTFFWFNGIIIRRVRASEVLLSDAGRCRSCSPSRSSMYCSIRGGASSMWITYSNR